jgi:aminopeptidase N
MYYHDVFISKSTSFVYLCSVGIYRVHYSSSMLESLTHGIHERVLSPQDRFNVQADVYALARAGHIDYIDYLKLLRYAYKYEDNLTVWKSILRHLTELGSIFDYAHLNNTKVLYQRFVCSLLDNVNQKLQWDSLSNESSQEAMLRSLILTHLGINGDRKIHDEAYRRFHHFVIQREQKNYSMNPNIRAAIYLTVAKTGDQQTFEQLKKVI